MEGMINMKRRGNAVALVLVVVVIVVTVMMMTGHKFSKHGKDTPADFNAFLDSCSDIERIQMLQALRQLPSFNKAGHIFNAVMDLNMGEIYVNYNDVEPEDVLKAVKEGKIDRSDISASTIRKALVYRAYNKVTYFFRDDNEVDYHYIVQWAAGEVGVPKEKIDMLSTYQLEKEVSQKFFSETWESLAPQQREKLIRNIKTEGVNFFTNVAQGVMEDIAQEMAQRGAQQVFYNYKGDPSTAMLLLTANMLSNAAAYAFADKDAVCMFIMTVSMIKSK